MERVKIAMHNVSSPLHFVNFNVDPRFLMQMSKEYPFFATTNSKSRVVIYRIAREPISFKGKKSSSGEEPLNSDEFQDVKRMQTRTKSATIPVQTRGPL